MKLRKLSNNFIKINGLDMYLLEFKLKIRQKHVFLYFVRSICQEKLVSQLYITLLIR